MLEVGSSNRNTTHKQRLKSSCNHIVLIKSLRTTISPTFSGIVLILNALTHCQALYLDKVLDKKLCI